MSLFEQILNTNIINFLIVISTLIFIFKKAHLGDLIEKMANDAREKIKKSEADAQNAISEYKNAKYISSQTPKMQDEIMQNAKTTARNFKEKIQNETLQKKVQIIGEIEKIQSNNAQKIKKMTTDEIYNACIDIAQDEIIQRLNDDFHKKIINSSIDELDKIEGNLF